MTVALTGTGGAFTRLGAAAYLVNTLDTHVGSTTNSNVSNIATEFASNEQPQFAAVWDARDQWRTAGDQWRGDVFSLIQQGWIYQVDRDVTLLSLTLADAVAELIQQMKDSSDSLNAPTLGATVTANVANTGDTTLVTTTTDGDGLPLDCLFAETVRVRCTAASAASPFTETLECEGDPAVDATAYNWPQGSGTAAVLTTVDPAVDGLIANGDFEDFTVTNTPDSWTIAVGTVTTHVTRQASPRRTTEQYCVRLTSDGSTLVKLRQQFTSTLEPLTLYAVTFTAKINTADATGAFRVALVDSGGTVVNDAQGNANSSTVGVNGGSGIGTSYTQFTAWFRTPAKAVSTWQLEFGFTTSPTSGRTVDVDLVSIATPTQLYTGGPYAIAWGNATTPVVGDRWTIAYTNSLGTDSLVRNCDRFFGTRDLGLKFPTAASETVSDSLIA